MNPARLSYKHISSFQKKIHAYYKKNKRDFPWRKTTHPYHVMVSEIMLQQTQTDRVKDKFTQFISAFPSFKSLAHAPLAQVLKTWQGMGYNRRALHLRQAAQHIIKQYKNKLPRDPEVLHTLPGIGPATARSILAFAFNKPVVFIETNIRTVFIHEFFRSKQKVSDRELLPFIEQTLDRKNPRIWYNALMDYGVMLKKSLPNPSRKSIHHVKQKSFEGSDRKVRGRILRLMLQSHSLTQNQILKKLDHPHGQILRSLLSLKKDHLLVQKGSIYCLPKD